jgi:hypothetical protein
MGMWDIFFQQIRSCVSFTKREFICLKITVIFNSFYSNHLSGGLQFDSFVGNVLSLSQAPALDQEGRLMGDECLEMMEISASLLHRCAINYVFQI